MGQVLRDLLVQLVLLVHPVIQVHLASRVMWALLVYRVPKAQ